VKKTAILLAAAALAGLPVAAQDLARWRYYTTLQLDTTAAGANVAGDVATFPLAVTLNASTLDFSQAKPNGADIRFSASKNGPPLPHAIEHWDRTAKSAAVWVKVDVKGNRKDQTLFLYWGNAAAADASDPKAVFDTKDGFVGVWHLGEDGNTEPDGYKDATANAAHATGVNLKPGSRGEGRVGKAASFQYAAVQWIQVANEKRKLFDVTDKLTFSIWAKANSYSNKGDEATRALAGYETMFAKGDNSWRVQKFGPRSWHKPPADLIEMCVEKATRADLCVVGKTDMVTGQWFHLLVVHDHPQAKLYVNGVLDKAGAFDSEWKSDDHPVGIGNQSQFPQRGRQWDGMLDEARFLNVVKDDHWIKLDYESQREGQKLLTFGKAQRNR
jgi:hypothetical protein